MARGELPEMPSPSIAELRRLWRQHRTDSEHDETIRRLVIDVLRLRELVVELDGLFGAVHRARREETRSNLVALERARVVFMQERSRNGALTSEPPRAPPDATRRFP